MPLNDGDCARSLVRWCENGPALLCYSDCPCEINGSADGTISIFHLCVWDYTINHNNNNTQQAGPEPGGSSNKHPIYVVDYPGKAFLFATREGFWGDDVAAAIILQRGTKKAENIRPENLALILLFKYAARGQHYLSSIFPLFYSLI